MTALVWAAAALAITSIVSVALLRGWRGWLDLKRYEIAADRSGPEPEPEPEDDTSSGLRIEMADIRERLRKLEAIATGVDL
ncbi:hypothetical protein [Sphingosinicella humi]|uniref:Uncharacterized protein n=1 Tax=Allosphingosinicella humi TaxID=2068657 RepID=A0A2U2J2V5_9SPHN|nr:hypothetical protein [Sphingosinicella humi]PWG02679.1 hypothetical protein DF286_07245 [Sphingosinicella humi]